MNKSTLCVILGSGGKKTVCKPCARKVDVQTLCKHNSPRNLCKLVQMYHDRLNAFISLWFGRGASRSSAGRKGSVREHNRPTIVLRLSTALVTQQRGFDARPVKQDARPAQSHTRNFAGYAPVEQCAATDWQPRQQLLLVNEASLACRCLAFFSADANFSHARAGWRRADGTLKIIVTVHTSDLLFITIEDSTRSRTGALCNLYTK